MDDQAIKTLIQQEFQKSNSASRFQLTPTSSHNHDGINTPTTFQPILTYVGAIASDGTVLLLPQGWTVFKDTAAGDGIYYVTHNLSSSRGGGVSTASLAGGTAFYSCTASAIQSTNIFAVPVVSAFPNEVDFVWGDIATAAKADTGFNFILTVINNRKTTIPSYYGQYV